MSYVHIRRWDETNLTIYFLSLYSIPRSRLSHTDTDTDTDTHVQLI